MTFRDTPRVTGSRNRPIAAQAIAVTPASSHPLLGTPLLLPSTQDPVTANSKPRRHFPPLSRRLKSGLPQRECDKSDFQPHPYRFRAVCL